MEPTHATRLVSSPLVTVRAGRHVMAAELYAPPHASGTVVVVHGSSTSAQPRNRAVAKAIANEGFATLMFDLVARHEELGDPSSPQIGFDIALIASRLIGALDWVRHGERVPGAPLGIFASGSGVAAALIAATRVETAAIVACGGRVELAGMALSHVHTPTLAIIGRDDKHLEKDTRALRSIKGPSRVHAITGATTSNVDDPRSVDAVVEAAARWFRLYLAVGH